MQDLDIKLVKDQSAGRCKRGYRENQLLFCKSHLVNGSELIQAQPPKIK